MKKLFLFILMFLALINLVSAVVVYGEFENGLSSITINRNQETTFNSVIFSNNPPISYDVKMYNENGNLVKTFVDTTTNNNYVSNRFTITRDDYQVGGLFTITINAIDSLNDNELTSLRLQVINNAPILNPIGNKQINEGQLLQFTITASDPDNDSLILSAINLPQGATFQDNQDNTGLFLWQTDFFDSGIYDVEFIVDDGQFTDNEIITITVINVPLNPSIEILAPLENEIIRAGAYNVRWQANDLDQDDARLDIKLEYTYNGLDWIILEDLQDNNDGIFTWDIIALSNADDYMLRATVTDDDGNQAQDIVIFAIQNPFAPIINIIRPIENEIISGNYNILWQANDLNQVADTLDIKLEYRARNTNFIYRILNFLGFSLQQWIILEDLQDNNDGIFTWDTAQVSNGNYELRATVTDDDGLTGVDYVALFTINNIITPINNPPQIISNPITLAYVNELYNYDVQAIDPDNDPLTYSLITNPSGMNIDVNTGLITWIPSQVGFYNTIVSVSDSSLSDMQSFVIEVRQRVAPITTVEEFEKHKIQISNVILTYNDNDNDLNVFINIKNQGNRKESVKVITTIMNNGLQKEEKIRLSVNQGMWHLTKFDIPKSNYVVKVEVISKNDRDVKYAYIS